MTNTGLSRLREARLLVKEIKMIATSIGVLFVLAQQDGR